MSQSGEAGRKGSFKDLDVWKKTCELVLQAYGLTETMPAPERFEVAKHMRQTAWSVPLNIAEGCARYRRTEFLHFLNIAAGSLAEVETFFAVGRRLGRGDAVHCDICDASATEIGRMLHGLINRPATNSPCLALATRHQLSLTLHDGGDVLFQRLSPYPTPAPHLSRTIPIIRSAKIRAGWKQVLLRRRHCANGMLHQSSPCGTMRPRPMPWLTDSHPRKSGLT